MRVLITGATGVVGKYLVRELLDNIAGEIEQIVTLSRSNYHRYEDHPSKDTAIVLPCWGDLRMSPIRLITQFNPTHIFHCAGEGRQSAPSRDIWAANVDTTFNLLEACKTLKEKVHVVYCSSIVVDHSPMNLYAASKLAGEHLVEASRDHVIGQSVRFPAVAGAGNRHGVVKAIIEKLLDKSPILSLYTNSRKPIIYAGYLARGMIWASKEPHMSRYQMCPRNSIYVEDIAKLAMEITHINKEIQWLGNKLEDNNSIVYPVKSRFNMYRSDENVSMAIADILREDYKWQI